VKHESSDKPASQPKVVPPQNGLIIFDFDGTITTKDTFALFLRYYAGFWSWLKNITTLLPVFISYKLGRIDRHAVKIAVIRKFFSGEKVSDIEKRAQTFAKDIIPGLIRPKALEHFREKMMEADRVYICSASITPYLLYWADSLNFPRKNVLAVELSESSGILSGEIEGYNVWGENKINRISDTFRSKNVRIAEAYGDSEGDRELLNAAEASFFRPFRV
jgi:phosphatidylglycerophosphatase C